MIGFMLSLIFGAAFSQCDNKDNFGAYNDGDTLFTSGTGEIFMITGDLSIQYGQGYGSGADDYYVATPLSLIASGVVGSFEIISPGKGFKVCSIHSWTSANQGLSDYPGNVMFTGQLANGGNVSETIMITPTGVSGYDWDSLSFDSTALDSQIFTSLAFRLITADLNYLALDEFEYEVVSVPVSREELLDSYVPVYPNPAEDVVHLNLPHGHFEQVRLRDLTGRVLNSWEVGGRMKLDIDLSSIPSGLYFVELESDYLQTTRRVIKR